MLEYIKIYATSVESPNETDNSSKKAMELYRYLSNNKEGLLAYNKRGIIIPEPQEGILYKGMGIQETQNCTVITMQMKEVIETLSAAKAPKKDGKGNPYIDRVTQHMPLFDAMQTASRKVFKRAFGY